MAVHGKRSRWVGRLVGLALAAVVPLLLLPGTANAAVPTYVVQPYAPAQEVGHQCSVIGSDSYGNEAVHCAELLVMMVDVASSEIVVLGQNEVFCQNAANVVVECAGIHETPDICRTPTGGCLPGSAGICGLRFGHSSCGVRRVINDTAAFYQWNEIWQYWAASINDQVVLPTSGKTVGGTGVNPASAHYCITA
jgi:hypothetical protein